MVLVQILLPLRDNDNRLFDREEFERVEDELTEAFGGVTAFVRAPAKGRWKKNDQATDDDAIAIFEVMADQLDRAWWRTYRHRLETRFRQEKIIVRSSLIELL
jgi:hypothetical protein